MTEDLTLQHKETDVGIIYEGDVNKGGQKGVILSQIGICTALTATDYKQPKQIIQFKSSAMRGRNPDNPSDRRSGIPTEQSQNYRIRKLTPRECFRLMGVSEENIDKIQNAGISKTQQYKMAGNSIVVDVLYYIIKKLFIDKKANKGDEQILF